MELNRVAAAAVLAGVLSHTLLFFHNEWHLKATYLLKMCSCLSFSLWLFVYLCTEKSPAGATTESLLIFGSYVGGLFTSIMTYRVFFHRLCRFPGPPLACVSKLWHVAQCLESKNHLLMERMHRNYGNFVRTGRV